MSVCVYGYVLQVPPHRTHSFTGPLWATAVCRRKHAGPSVDQVHVQVADPCETLSECGGGSGVSCSGGMIGWWEDEGVCHHAPSAAASHLTQRKNNSSALVSLHSFTPQVKSSGEYLDFILHL